MISNITSGWTTGKPVEEPNEIYPAQVGMYRTGSFLDLGFDVEQAAKLGNSRVDLNDVRKAIRTRGCTIEMAWKIWGTE